ncbi:MAG: Small subunit (SSU) processome component [Chaenotheca gracillima]|nr:MAG: Small subunit (SSU) processome component [Chaenotheca gracillima]
MKVIIVGAGIAGLSAGVALRQTNHEVLILEKSSFANEIGAAIWVPPNALRILKRWGFSLERAQAVKARKFRRYRGDSFETIVEQDLLGLEGTYGSPLYFCHRVDLHSELKYLATRADEGTAPVTIRTRAEVRNIDPEHGVVTLKDSSTLHADLIIGAGGIHSFAASLFNDHTEDVISVDKSLFRFLIPTAEIIKDEETRFYVEEPGTAKQCLGHDGTVLVTYPCRRETIQNCAIFHHDTGKTKNLGTEDWTKAATVQDVLKHCDGLHPSIVKVIRKATEIKHWKLLVRRPLERWYKSRLVVVGDAAHAMLPFQGQGGAQAIEDAAALGTIFASVKSTSPLSIESIEKRLSIFQSVRKDRASAIQAFSSAGPEEEYKMVKTAKEFVKDGKVPLTFMEFVEWNYRHDVVVECKKVMVELNLGFEPRDSRQSR